jgi:hypothetical protein
MFSINWCDGSRAYTLLGDQPAVASLYGMLVRKTTYQATHIRIYDTTTGAEVNGETWDLKVSAR